jgi:hypothetical protein
VVMFGKDVELVGKGMFAGISSSVQEHHVRAAAAYGIVDLVTVNADPGPLGTLGRGMDSGEAKTGQSEKQRGAERTASQGTAVENQS